MGEETEVEIEVETGMSLLEQLGNCNQTARNKHTRINLKF